MNKLREFWVQYNIYNRTIIAVGIWLLLYIPVMINRLFWASYEWEYYWRLIILEWELYQPILTPLEQYLAWSQLYWEIVEYPGMVFTALIIISLFSSCYLIQWGDS